MNYIALELCHRADPNGNGIIYITTLCERWHMVVFYCQVEVLRAKIT